MHITTSHQHPHAGRGRQITQLVQRTTLARSSLTDENRHAPHAVSGRGAVLGQQRTFTFASDEWRQPRERGTLETRTDVRRAQHAIRDYRFGVALHLYRVCWLAVHERRDETARLGAEENRVRLGCRVES